MTVQEANKLELNQLCLKFLKQAKLEIDHESLHAHQVLVWVLENLQVQAIPVDYQAGILEQAEVLSQMDPKELMELMGEDPVEGPYPRGKDLASQGAILAEAFYDQMRELNPAICQNSRPAE